MAEIDNPHDAFFKDLFSRPEAVHDFVAHHLPPEIASLLNLTTLEQQAGAFVDDALQAHYSDVLYRVQLHEGGACHIYLLFEHKSRAEKLTPLQLLRYQVNIWTQEAQNNPNLTELTPIFPIVFYHGLGNWQVARNFTDLVDIRPHAAALRQYVPQFVYHLFEARFYDERTPRDAALLRIGLAVLKYIFRRDMGAKLREFFDIFQELDEDAALAYIRVVLHYVTGIAHPAPESDVSTAVKEAFPRLKGDVMMSIVEKWEHIGLEKGLRQGLYQGRQEGLQLGKQEGLQEGLQKGLREGERKAASTIALRQLERRFGKVPVRLAGQISKLPLATLEEMSLAIFDFHSIKDVTAWVREAKAKHEPSA